MNRLSLARTPVVAVVLAIVLAGCVPQEAVQTSTPTPPPTPTPTATAAPAPALKPGESAEANQPYWDQVNTDFYAAHGMSDGRSIIDNLVAAGFVKADMQVTPDRTAIDLAVDSIYFSVKLGDECLLGQFTPGAYHGSLGPALSTGGCLVGLTRPIDW
jgi:hypothetical protein